MVVLPLAWRSVTAHCVMLITVYKYVHGSQVGDWTLVGVSLRCSEVACTETLVHW